MTTWQCGDHGLKKFKRSGLEDVSFCEIQNGSFHMTGKRIIIPISPHTLGKTHLCVYP